MSLRGNELVNAPYTREKVPYYWQNFPNVKEIIKEFPFLKNLLEVLFECDQATFLHCMAVDQTGWGLIQDLLLYLPQLKQHKTELKQARGFLLLHDIGKVFAEIDIDLSNLTVHDPRSQGERPIAQLENHFLHPAKGFAILSILSQHLYQNGNFPESYSVANWAHLSLHHHNRISSIVSIHATDHLSPELSTNLVNKIIFLAFRIADLMTSVSLPKPNNGTPKSWDEASPMLFESRVTREKIINTFGEDYFQNETEIENLTNFILASIKDHLQKIKDEYPPQVWDSARKKVGNNNPTKQTALIRQRYMTQMLDSYGPLIEQITSLTHQTNLYQS